MGSRREISSAAGLFMACQRSQSCWSRARSQPACQARGPVSGRYPGSRNDAPERFRPIAGRTAQEDRKGALGYPQRLQKLLQQHLARVGRRPLLREAPSRILASSSRRFRRHRQGIWRQRRKLAGPAGAAAFVGLRCPQLNQRAWRLSVFSSRI